MKLHRLVRGSINAINRNKQLVWLRSQGPIIDATGLATPTYAAPQTIWGQVQPVSTDTLAHMEQLNIQGVLRSVYLYGAVVSAVRVDGTGGDLLQFPELWKDGVAGPTRTWLVMLVEEQWDSWCKVVVRLQNDMAGNDLDWTADSDVTADSSLTADG